MYQPDRGSYRTKQTAFKSFRRSCLGRILMLVAVLAVLGVIAALTRPSIETMREKMTDNIRQWIETPDSIQTDGIDDFITNIGYTFSSAEGEPNTELLMEFNRFNRLEFYEHALFTSVYIFNNYRLEGERCGIGLFGMVIPTVNFNDFMLTNDTLRREYNQQLIRNVTVGQEEYFGENPDLGGVFQYKDQPR